MPSLSSLKPIFLHCGVYPFLSILQLRSPLFRQSKTLAHLTLPPHNLVIWIDGSAPFPFGKNVYGILDNCSLCGTEATFSFWQTQFAQAFPPKLAPFCKLFAVPGNTNKSAIFVLLLFDYHHPVPSLFFSPVLLSYNGSPVTRFSWRTKRMMNWQDGNATRALCNPLWSLYSYLSSTLVFSDWRRTVSSKFFDTQVSTEELVLPRHARCVLSRFCCNGHSFLLSSSLRLTESRILNTTPAVNPGQLLSYIHRSPTDSLRCSFWRLFGLSTTSVSCFGFYASS